MHATHPDDTPPACGAKPSCCSRILLVKCCCSVVEASAATGIPPLTHVEIESCPNLSARAIRVLVAPAVQQHQQQQHVHAPASSQDGPGRPQQQQLQQLQRPAYPHLQQLTLTYSGTRSASQVVLPVDLMQAAMPRLQELRVSGLGGTYGFMCSVPARTKAATLPGWPQLQVLHVGGYFGASFGSLSRPVHGGTSLVNDALLLQIAGRSPCLHELDLSATMVTPRGLLALATALAAQQPPGEHHQQQQQGEGLMTAGGEGAAAARGRQAQHNNAAADGDDAADAQEQAAVAAVQGALRLRRVQLDGSRLANNEGLHMLGRLCCETLEEVVVRNSGAAVSDGGVRSLAACTRLQSIDLTSSAVTDAGVCVCVGRRVAAVGVVLEACARVCGGCPGEK